MRHEDDEPAFPGAVAWVDKGMGLRDWFAGQAAAGLLACYTKYQSQTFPYADEIAERAYEIADAMLAQRDR